MHCIPTGDVAVGSLGLDLTIQSFVMKEELCYGLQFGFKSQNRNVNLILTVICFMIFLID